jgi:anti-sigma factor RsiW
MLTFTVFESQSKQGRTRTGNRRNMEDIQIQGTAAQYDQRGPTHILQWSISDLNFTVIGELHRDELIKVAESLILAAEQ